MKSIRSGHAQRTCYTFPLTLVLTLLVSLSSHAQFGGNPLPPASAAAGSAAGGPDAVVSQAMPGGELRVLGENNQDLGACPLKHTAVEADITGYVGRVKVRQTFHNPLPKKIEAIYVFPLPQEAAVDDMTMTVGSRRISGQIKRREEARAIYEAARESGHVASLLDQERPNIFTQSVANIEPGVQVVIEISYVETLKFEDGVFEWVFPTVVGPRYMPGTPTGQQGSGWSPDTTQVPDASRISPPVTLPGTRAGHDISLTVKLDAGLPLLDISSTLHPVDIKRHGRESATVALKHQQEIPNKDFILCYRTATEKITDAFLHTSDGRSAYFTFVLQPPQRVTRAQAVPRELVFVLDTSGSMGGFPIEKAKAVMAQAIDGMGPQDTFNLITFSGDTHILWDKPRPNTTENRAAAQGFLASRAGGGGTEMMKAINAALEGQAAGHIRVVCFMTDGYVGNDGPIIDAVKKNAGTARVFSFGIGNSVNRFLLDGMAHAGRGAVEYVTLGSGADAAAQRFYERINAPVLTDIQIDWGQLPVEDVYPKQIPDLFSSKPIMISGRLRDATEGTITLRGNTVAGPFERRIRIDSTRQEEHEALASVWARAKVVDLMAQSFAAPSAATTQEVTQLGLDYRLMTPFTSFVAVEEMTVTVGGQPMKIAVPVEMPDGVSYEGVFGDRRKEVRALRMNAGAVAGGIVALGGFAGGAPGPQGATGPRGPAGPQGATPPAATPPAATLPPGVPAIVAAPAQNGLLVDGKPAGDRLTPMPSKLADPLRGLAAQVEKEGKDGNLTVGKLRVVNHKVDVMIYLRDTSEKTLAALRQLGFVQTGESKAIRLLIGTLDVRKLDELVKLEAVIRVTPVGG